MEHYDYPLRNRILVRWSIITFVVSLILVLSPQLGFRPPTQECCLLPDLIPRWLAQPINITLLVVVLVWLMTNRLSLKLGYKYEREEGGVLPNHLLGVLIGLVVGLCFTPFFSCRFLLTTSALVMFTTILYLKHHQILPGSYDIWPTAWLLSLMMMRLVYDLKIDHLLGDPLTIAQHQAIIILMSVGLVVLIVCLLFLIPVLCILWDELHNNLWPRVRDGLKYLILFIGLGIGLVVAYIVFEIVYPLGGLIKRGWLWLFPEPYIDHRT